MNQMKNVRKYQFFGGMMIVFFYFFIYRPYIHPRTVMNSVMYHKSLRILEANPLVRENVGAKFFMMTCNGKYCPLLTNCQYYMMVQGPKGKARFDVDAKFD